MQPNHIDVDAPKVITDEIALQLHADGTATIVADTDERRIRKPLAAVIVGLCRGGVDRVPDCDSEEARGE